MTFSDKRFRVLAWLSVSEVPHVATTPRTPFCHRPIRSMYPPTTKTPPPLPPPEPLPVPAPGWEQKSCRLAPGRVDPLPLQHGDQLTARAAPTECELALGFLRYSPPPQN